MTTSISVRFPSVVITLVQTSHMRWRAFDRDYEKQMNEFRANESNQLGNQVCHSAKWMRQNIIRFSKRQSYQWRESRRIRPTAPVSSLQWRFTEVINLESDFLRWESSRCGDNRIYSAEWWRTPIETKSIAVWAERFPLSEGENLLSASQSQIAGVIRLGEMRAMRRNSCVTLWEGWW